MRRQLVGQLRTAAMVLIHNMDPEEEQLQIVAYEEPEAFAASHADNRQGMKMTPKVPPQFDGQSSWFEYEDLIDDWLGITTLDPDKHGPSLKNLVGAASFYNSMLDIALLRDPDRGLAHFQGHIETILREGSKSCVPFAVPSDVSHISRPERIQALDRAFRNRSEALVGIMVRPA